MKTKIKTRPWNIFEELKTERDIKGFVKASIEEARNDPDPRHIIHALEVAAKARGMLKTAKDSKLTRAGLYRSLRKDSDPKTSTLTKIAGAFGYKITLAPIKPAGAAKTTR